MGDLFKKDIMLKIVGKQFENGNEETNLEFVTEGKLYERGQAIYLVYEETELSGMPGCQTRLKLSGNKVKLSRSGEEMPLDTEIEFEKGAHYKGLYDTPFGAIEMEVLTNDVKNNIRNDGTGSLDIDYHISLKGLTDARSKLNIEIM